MFLIHFLELVYIRTEILKKTKFKLIFSEKKFLKRNKIYLMI